MSYTAEQLQTLVVACEQFRGATAPDGYPDGLALCVIDSVQSTGVTYSSVENVIARYRAYRRDQGGDPNRDGVRDLLATIRRTRRTAGMGGDDRQQQQDVHSRPRGVEVRGDPRRGPSAGHRGDR